MWATKTAVLALCLRNLSLTNEIGVFGAKDSCPLGCLQLLLDHIPGTKDTRIPCFKRPQALSQDQSELPLGPVLPKAAWPRMGCTHRLQEPLWGVGGLGCQHICARSLFRSTGSWSKELGSRQRQASIFPLSLGPLPLGVKGRPAPPPW